MSILPMKAANVEAWVERGYREGARYQWGRETSVNAMEAGATRVEFGIEWQAVEKLGIYRRLIADNGRGMNDRDLLEFMVTMGGGGKPIGDEHENFGVGAKTSLCPWNKAGTVVVSWVDGIPSMIRIVHDEQSGEYGLLQEEDEDGDLISVYEPYVDEHGIDWEAIRPDWMAEQDGTVIVLLGQHPGEDTVRGDTGRDEDGTKQLALYLNTRFWSFDRCSIQVVELTSKDKSEWPRSKPANGEPEAKGGVFTRRIRGAEHYILGQHVKIEDARFESGSVRLEDAEVDWYLWVGEKPKTFQNIHPYAPARGFIAARYQGELYHHQTHHQTFRMFGITEEKVRSNLWLIVRPPLHDKARKIGVYPRGDRNTLYWHAGRELPWNQWGDRFSQQLPQPIVNALRAARGDTIGTLDDTWKERIAARFAPLWKIDRYRQDPEGDERSAAASMESHSAKNENADERSASDKPRAPRIRLRKPGATRIFSGAGDEANARKARIKGGLPDYDAKREPLTLEEPSLLVTYNKPSSAYPSGVVQIYLEHPVIKQSVQRWQAHYPPLYADEVRATVEKAYCEVAVCKIGHSEQLKKLFNEEIIENEMRSPRALTMAMLGMMAEDALISDRLHAAIRVKRVRVAQDAAA